jgi:thiol-disulfide isomerase/thioredoxin
MKKQIFWIAVLAVFAGLVWWLIVTPGKGGALDSFATCLEDKGVKFYGAFWCPHCQAEKALFGRSAKKLPYIECSNPDRSQNELCTSLGIESYPTFVFPAGLAGSTSTATTTGEISLEDLAAKSSCQLPS